MKAVSVIGTGNMGSAMVRGLIASGKVSRNSVVVYDVDAQKAGALEEELGTATASSVSDTIRPDTEILVFAVKPQILGPVLEEAAPHIHERPLVISIAAGISTEFILSKLRKEARVIRAMPNAAAMVGCSATALCKAGKADQEDLDRALDLFSAFGSAVSVEEKMMHAVTALSGSGPGYLFVIMEAMTDGAVLMGMDRPTARRLAVQTVLGAAIMAQSEDAAFSDLKDRITSPGGTTIAGLQVMEQGGIRGILMDAIEAATRRGEALQSKG